SPAVPAAGETIRVTARVTSATPNPEVRLWHRLDNNNGDGAWASKLMFDDGVASGDAAAGDGIYTATLTEYTGNGQIAQFYVTAQAGGQASQMPKWGRDRPAMVVVDTPSGVGDLRRMRFVLSAFDLRTINDQDNPTGSYGYAFPRLANHYFNMTLIINERDVVYNCEIRNSGSPWTRGGGLSRGKFKLPKDQLFRGKVKYSYDNDAGGGSRHHNRITRHWLYLLGHPANEHEYIQVEVNNAGSALREEVEPLGNDMMDRIYQDGSQGDLYRIDDEWWFTDAWGRSSRNSDWSYKGTDNAGRYRTEWIKRTREDEDDFAALISMFRKINSGYTQAEIETLIDPVAVMKMSAVRGYIYDWDSFSLNRGKNGYLYRRSTDGRFMFFHWDSDLAFQDANNIFYNGMTGFRPYLLQSYNFRLFKHYLARLVEEFTRNSPRINAWLQAEESASAQYDVSGAYQTWFANREAPANAL
ncbi:MAG TPA: CotH kinase family protein, partial [Verrucomicrobiae bacterium]|nr:CotH kinase family protein [Verrucomicrobiae bacterium]